MNYLKFEMHYQTSGAVVEVALRGVESDVFLLDDMNLRQFERGGRFSYIGGHYRGSPIRLRVPSSRTWTVVVVPSPGGTIHASANVISAA